MLIEKVYISRQEPPLFQWYLWWPGLPGGAMYTHVPSIPSMVALTEICRWSVVAAPYDLSSMFFMQSGQWQAAF